MSGPIYLDGLEFLLNVTKTRATNVIFTLDVVLGPGYDFVCALLLTFEFSVIFEILVIEDDYDWSAVSLSENVLSQCPPVSRE